MRSGKNLEGQRFTKLTVIERDFSKKKASWKCICDCGKEISTQSSNLTSGHTRSCGCLKKEIVDENVKNLKYCEDLTGKIFGLLTVLSRDFSIKRNESYWTCRCECGNIKSIKFNDLNNNKTVNCGCVRKKILFIKRAERVKNPNIISNNRLYKTWAGMKSRCYNKNLRNYPRYGGRGITVCKEWLNNPEVFIEYVSKLENFCKDTYTIDRINNDGNYEPGNIRWASKTTQARNTRLCKLSVQKVKEIKELYKDNTASEIAKIYNTTKGQIYNIVHGSAWKDRND